MSTSVYPTGTTIYDPEKCWNGYTLYPTQFLRGDEARATLVDMNDNLVNQWKGLYGLPPKMLPGGQVMGSSARQVGPLYHDNSDLIQVDWDGNVRWEFSRYECMIAPGARSAWTARQHHDYQREGNPVGYYVPGMDPLADKGNTLIGCHKNVRNPTISDKPLLDCTIIEVTWDGEVIWEWLCSDHFDEIAFSEEARETIARNPNMTRSGAANNAGPSLGDWVHMNSISALGPNKWFDMGDDRFHPDNIIWDGRQTNHMAITEKRTGKLVWQVGPDYTATEALRKLGQIIGQHHAHMIPRGLPGEGNILVFDNGGSAGYGAPTSDAPTGIGIARRDYSRVIEFDPTTLDIVWQYTPREAGLVMPQGASDFYSSAISGIQRLPNGNTLITDGHSGRLIEVTREHEIVWEYIAPRTVEVAGGSIAAIYRASRVPYDWVPQMAKPDEVGIPRIDNSTFRVPGSPKGSQGKLTRVKHTG